MAWSPGGSPLASALYPLYKQSCLTQSPAVVLSSDLIQFSVGRTSAYTADDSHQFKNSCATVQTASTALVNKTTALGVFDNTVDPLLTAVPTGAALDFAVVWKDTTNASTSPLICYFGGFSVTPNGGDITFQLDNTTNRIFKL